MGNIRSLKSLGILFSPNLNLGTISYMAEVKFLKPHNICPILCLHSLPITSPFISSTPPKYTKPFDSSNIISSAILHSFPIYLSLSILSDHFTPSK